MGLEYGAQGRYEEAAKFTRQELHPVPAHVGPYSHPGNYALTLQRFYEANQIIHEAQARKLDDVMFHDALYALALLGVDSAGMTEQQQWLARAIPSLRASDWRSLLTLHMPVNSAKRGS